MHPCFSNRDQTQTTGFYAQTQFKNKFGSYSNGVLEIAPSWQTGIQMAMSVGELIGLAITGFLSDRYGWKPILSGMMIMLTLCLLLFAFAQSLGMIVAAMVMCGELSLINFTARKETKTASRDSLGRIPDGLRGIWLGDGAHLSSSFRYGLGWDLLGLGLLYRRVDYTCLSESSWRVG